MDVEHEGEDVEFSWIHRRHLSIRWIIWVMSAWAVQLNIELFEGMKIAMILRVSGVVLNGLQVQKLNKLVMKASQELQKRANKTLGREKA